MPFGFSPGLARIEEIFDAEPGTPEADELDLLTVLAEAWEDENHPIEPFEDPVAFIEAYMEMMDYTKRDLAKVLGTASRASEVLNRRRHLNLGQIRALHREWKLPLDLLVQEYDLAAA